MSGKKPKSKEPSKNSRNSKDTSREGKLKSIEPPKSKKSVSTSIKDKTEEQLKSLGSKSLAFSVKIKNKIQSLYNGLIKKVFYREIYVKGQEPPKSFAFEKKFFGLYILFIFYSFVLILGINDPNNIVFVIFMFGNPFVFANAIFLFFFTLSLILNYDKLRLFIFENHSQIKQPIIFGVIIAFYYLVFLTISASFNYVNFYLILSMIWLVLLSSRYYTLSRKTSTKIEDRFISKYSYSRYMFALITPFIIMTILIIISLIYRSLLVFVALDFFGPEDPQNAVKVYGFAMRVVMPLIYFSLVITLVFIVIEFFATRRKAETRKAGCYDNFTFSLIILFIFFFQILQVSIFLLLRPETIAGFKTTVGATGTALTYLYLIQFAISMIFLYRIVVKLGSTFDWRVLFFKRDGLILFFLTCVFADTLTAFALASQAENQELTILGTILMANRYFISILMITFLGITLLVYYLKPHETSMFMRMQKETVKKEEEEMDIIYRLIKTEYIRRGEPYPIEILERELIKSTKLSKAEVYSLLRRLTTQKVDVQLTRKRDKSGDVVQMVDFLSVTEKFDRKDIAEEKAKKFISRKLIETTSAKERKAIKITKPLESEKASDQFIASLASTYDKKQKDQELLKERVKNGVSFTQRDLPDYLKNQILEILKKEYLYRIENLDGYPDFHFPISNIANQITFETRISAGEIYPILERLSRTDLELTLIKNSEEPQDKKIKFFPIADDEISYALSNFRPEEYSEVRIKVIKKLIPLLKQKTTSSNLASIQRKIPNHTESQKSWRTIMDDLNNYYPKFTKELLTLPDKSKMLKTLSNFKK
ncbi:MAG: hypothetical protein EU532_04370 [Promethearchaeota archaeon]|nr:MAG: hypothetical protein EU532_04370 [Candidatus Lokiarchaeota archaeon]